MSRVLDVVGETTENRGQTHGDGHGFFERLPHKSPFGAIKNTLVIPGFWMRFRREAAKKIHCSKTLTKISKFNLI